MAVEVNYTPSYVRFTSAPQDLAPIIATLRDAAISYEQKGEHVSVDLQAQGEGQEALLKGALVLDLVDHYSALDEEV